MNTYRIVAPHFVAGVVVLNDYVFQSAPILGWSVGRTFDSLRTYCRSRGWQVEPLAVEYEPSWLEYDGVAYELYWQAGVLQRITKHEPGEDDKDLSFEEIPEQLRGLL